MKRILSALIFMAMMASAYGQGTTKLCFPTVITSSGKTSCQNVDATNPLPTTATLSASGGVNVTVTNTTSGPVFVSNPNGFGGAVTISTVTVTNQGAGSLLNTLDTNSAAILSAVQAAIPAGTNQIGSVTVSNNPLTVTFSNAVVNPHNVTITNAAASPVNVSCSNCSAGSLTQLTVNNIVGAASTGGFTMITTTNLLTTTTAIKNSAGQLAKVYCMNPSAATAYLQVFNLTPGQVTLGTTKPVAFYGYPTLQAGGFVMNPIGDQFSSAISVAATTTSTGLTPPATGLECSFSYN